MSNDQIRCPHGALQKTSDLRCIEDVRLTSSWRRPIYDILETFFYVVLKTFCLWRLRSLIYDILGLSDLLPLEDTWFAISWWPLIYDILKTSVEWRLEDVCSVCCNVVATSRKRRKKWFSFYLVLSEIFRKYFCLG